MKKPLIFITENAPRDQARCDFTGKGPVLFQGVPLPYNAKGFKYLPRFGALVPEIQDWLMDLHYCWGRQRRLSSRRVLKYVERTHRHLRTYEVEAVPCIRKAFPECSEKDAVEIVDEWFKALEIIEREARKVSHCCWTVNPLDDDLENNITMAIEIAKKGIPDIGLPALLDDGVVGFEFRVRSLPREAQLNFMSKLSDFYSSPRSGFWRRAWERFTYWSGLKKK